MGRRSIARRAGMMEETNASLEGEERQRAEEKYLRERMKTTTAPKSAAVKERTAPGTAP